MNKLAIRNVPGDALKRGGLRGLAVVLMAAGAFFVSASALVPGAHGQTLDGQATIEDPGTASPLTSGGSTTPFTIGLPALAACSGDTAGKQYHIWGFMVPPPASGQSLDQEMHSVNWFGTNYYNLYDTSGTQYGPANTASGTGQVANVPNFTFQSTNANGQPILQPAGQATVYEVGIACTDATPTTSDFWYQTVTFNPSTTDPNRFTWTTATSGGTTTTTSSSTSSTSTSSTSSTTLVPNPTTTSTTLSTTTTTTGDPGTTTTTTTSAGGSVAGGSGDGSALGSSGGSGTGGSSGGASSGTTSTLANTGAEVKRELSFGVALFGTGAFLMALVLPAPTGLDRMARRLARSKSPR